MTASTDEQTFKPVDLSLSDIKATIPSHLFERDTARGLRYLARDIVQAIVLAAAIYNIDVYLNNASNFPTEYTQARVVIRYLAWSL